MNLFRKKKVYLDYASATPVLPSIVRVMKSYWSKHFYNPSAIYAEGRALSREIDEYRTKVARLLGVTKSGVIFTSGGTESVSLAILGAFEVAKESIKTPHLIVSAIEHASVLEAASEVYRRGGKVSVVPVDQDGLVSPEEVVRLIKPSTFLISIILGSNEIGTLQNMSKIGRAVREKRSKKNAKYPYLHTDASQAPSYVNVNLEKLSVDMLTLDAGKIYGPKSSGVLAMKGGVDILSANTGGQERGLRPGTENPALIAGLTFALSVAERDREREYERMSELRDYFILGLHKRIPDAIINGSQEQNLPHIISVSIPGVLAEFLVLALEKKGVLVSTGSACSFLGDKLGSDVIRAIGREDMAESTLRFSLGRFSTKKDIDFALEMLYTLVKYDATIRTLHNQGQGGH